MKAVASIAKQKNHIKVKKERLSVASTTQDNSAISYSKYWLDGCDSVVIAFPHFEALEKLTSHKPILSNGNISIGKYVFENVYDDKVKSFNLASCDDTGEVILTWEVVL